MILTFEAHCKARNLYYIAGAWTRIVKSMRLADPSSGRRIQPRSDVHALQLLHALVRNIPTIEPIITHLDQQLGCVWNVQLGNRDLVLACPTLQVSKLVKKDTHGANPKTNLERLFFEVRNSSQAASRQGR